MLIRSLLPAAPTNSRRAPAPVTLTAVVAERLLATCSVPPVTDVVPLKLVSEELSRSVPAPCLTRLMFPFNAPS